MQSAIQTVFAKIDVAVILLASEKPLRSHCVQWSSVHQVQITCALIVACLLGRAPQIYVHKNKLHIDKYISPVSNQQALSCGIQTRDISTDPAEVFRLNVCTFVPVTTSFMYLIHKNIIMILNNNLHVVQSRKHTLQCFC